MCHSWERIMPFAPWVTHYVLSLHVKCPKYARYWPYNGCMGMNYNLCLLLQMDIPVNYPII